MIAWLLVALISYIILAVTSLIDKILLSGPLSDAKIYAFYIGILSSAAFLLLFFDVWGYPTLSTILLGITAGIAQIMVPIFI